MKELIFLTVFLIFGHQIASIEAITVGMPCFVSGPFASNPDNKAKYFYCINKVVYSATCPEDQYFDITSLRCVYSLYCAENIHGTNKYTADKTKYFFCLNGQTILVSCSTNMYYNPTTKECTPILPPPTCLPGSNNVFGTGCNTFVLCMGGVGLPQTCPNDLYFQEATGTCVATPPPGCSDGGSTGITCTESSKVKPFVGNCSKYLKCNGKTWEDKDCPPGYYFSAEKLNCGPAASTKCPYKAKK